MNITASKRNTHYMATLAMLCSLLIAMGITSSLYTFATLYFFLLGLRPR